MTERDRLTEYLSRLGAQIDLRLPPPQYGYAAGKIELAELLGVADLITRYAAIAKALADLPTDPPAVEGGG